MTFSIRHKKGIRKVRICVPPIFSWVDIEDSLIAAHLTRPFLLARLKYIVLTDRFEVLSPSSWPQRGLAGSPNKRRGFLQLTDSNETTYQENPEQSNQCGSFSSPAHYTCNCEAVESFRYRASIHGERVTSYPKSGSRARCAKCAYYFGCPPAPT